MINELTTLFIHGLSFICMAILTKESFYRKVNSLTLTFLHMLGMVCVNVFVSININAEIFIITTLFLFGYCILSLGYYYFNHVTRNARAMAILPMLLFVELLIIYGDVL